MEDSMLVKGDVVEKDCPFEPPKPKTENKEIDVTSGEPLPDLGQWKRSSFSYAGWPSREILPWQKKPPRMSARKWIRQRSLLLNLWMSAKRWIYSLKNIVSFENWVGAINIWGFWSLKMEVWEYPSIYTPNLWLITMEALNWTILYKPSEIF